MRLTTAHLMRSYAATGSLYMAISMVMALSTIATWQQETLAIVYNNNNHVVPCKHGDFN